MRAEDFHGEELAETLRRKYHLEMEMTAPEYVIAMTSLMDTEEGFERLGTALLEIGGALRHCVEPEQQKEKGESKEKERCETPEVTESKVLHPVRRMLICEAMNADTERTALQDTVGKVSAEFVYLYPPGIPLICPGERYSREMLELMRQYKADGCEFHGPSDASLEVLYVLKEE